MRNFTTLANESITLKTPRGSYTLACRYVTLLQGRVYEINVPDNELLSHGIRGEDAESIAYRNQDFPISYRALIRSPNPSGWIFKVKPVLMN